MTTPTPAYPTDDQHLHNNEPHVLLIQISQQDDQDEETRTIQCQSYAHAHEVKARERYALILETRWGGGLDREDRTYRALVQAGERGDWKTVNLEWDFSEELGVTFVIQPLETPADVQAQQDEQDATVARLLQVAEATEDADWNLIDVLHETANAHAAKLARSGTETQLRHLLGAGIPADQLEGILSGNDAAKSLN